MDVGRCRTSSPVESGASSLPVDRLVDAESFPLPSAARSLSGTSRSVPLQNYRFSRRD
jgi:hypothetical protein